MFSFCIMWWTAIYWTALEDCHDGNEQKKLKTTTDGLVDDGPPKVTRYHMRIPPNFSNLCNLKFFLFIFFGIFFKNSHDCSFLLKIPQIVVFFTKLRFCVNCLFVCAIFKYNFPHIFWSKCKLFNNFFSSSGY